MELDAPIRVDERADLDAVRAHGVDTFLAAVGDPLRWWRIGPRPDLVGVEVTDAEVSLVEVEADLVGTDGQVEVGSGEVPALLRGTVESVQPGDTIAVAVNGTIGATGPAIAFGDDDVFAVVVSDEWFHDGPNEIQLFRVDD